MIFLKRAYEKAELNDGIRILVDRLWPRGVRKDLANIDIWLKEIAPTTSLRKWHWHERNKWEEFKVYYYEELDQNLQPVQRVVELATKDIVTLVYGAKDTEHSPGAKDLS